MRTKKTNNILITAGLIGAVVLLTSSTVKAVDNILANVRVLFKGFRAEIKWAKFSLVLFFTYALQNDNDLTVENVTFSGTVSYEGVFIGNANTLAPVTIPAKSTTNDFTVGVEVGLATLPSTIKDLILQGSFSKNITVNGTLNNGVFSFPTGTQTIPLFNLPSGQSAIKYTGVPVLANAA